MEPLWQRLMLYEDSELFPVLFEVSSLPNFLPIAPTDNIANDLLSRLVKAYVKQERIKDAEVINWLNRMNRTTWIFTGIHLTALNKRIINEKLGTQYLTEEVRAILDQMLIDLT